jgi:2-methylcitrate dehydratase PrpD
VREKEYQMPESAATTVEKIAAFVVGCDSQSIAPDVRDTIRKHLLDSIGCAIGAIGARE